MSKHHWGLIVVGLVLMPPPAFALDPVKGWTGYCMYQFQHIPELMNASMLFKVPPSVACECVAPGMAVQTTSADNDYIRKTKQIPQKLTDLFSKLFQSCLIAYAPNSVPRP
jgi:hypothetical protein